MKKVNIVYRHVDTDTSSSSQTRLDRIINASRGFVKRDVKQLELRDFGAWIYAGGEDVVVITTPTLRYECRLAGQGEIFASDLNGSDTQKLKPYDAHYEYIKTLEGIVLRALREHH